MEADKVTSGKAKKPGRVAWGNKLATLAKAHKEEKATSKRQVHEDEVPKQKDASSSKNNIYVWVAMHSLAIGITALYNQRKAALRAPNPVEICKVPHKPPKKPAPNKIGMQRKFLSLELYSTMTDKPSTKHGAVSMELQSTKTIVNLLYH
jgi:hypothetical protein